MAVGDVLFGFNANMGLPPTTGNSAIRDERISSGGVIHYVVRFGAGGANHIMNFEDMISPHYSGGTIVIKAVGWTTSGVTGGVNMRFEIDRIGIVLDVDTSSFGTAVNVNNTSVPNNSGVPFIITANLTTAGQRDSVAAGELFNLRMTRVSGDTLSGGYELSYVIAQEA